MKKFMLIMALGCAAVLVFGQQVTDFTGGNVPLVTRGDFVLQGTRLVSYTGSAESLSIPANLGISEIGPSCFIDNSYLKTVIVPRGVQRIGRNAFSSCYNLTSVNLPDGLLVIDDNAFASCGNLLRVNIPAGITAIGSYAFGNCSKLTIITMPENIVYLSGNAMPGNFATAYENYGRRPGAYNFVRGFNTWRYGTEPVHQALLITPGTPASGSFQFGGEKWYYLNVPANGAIITAYTEGSIDTVMAVYDTNGTPLEEDDDSGTDYNARISIVTVGGVLYVKLRAYDGASSGAYQLHTMIEPL
ncbi:MAG: leucine-rich repeat domain-containing protein [Treponema sp.]|nr:leucine-rich repeat domain-containing protein [Treponema sp.]